MELFGFTIKKKADKKTKKIKEVVIPDNDEGTRDIITYGGSLGGHFVELYDSGVINADEFDLIKNYREMALCTEVDKAVSEIINDSITFEDNVIYPVKIDLDNVENMSDSTKEKIVEEFDQILHIMNFGDLCHDFFKSWYIDGRIYFHLIIDGKKVKDGIQKIVFIDSLYIKKIRNIKKSQTGEIEDIETYYIYKPPAELNNNNPYNNFLFDKAIKFTNESITYAVSGLMDAERKNVLSYLHKAIKPANQLAMLEDASVVYSVSRAPERRIFYVDVGNLPKTKAEAYLNSIMNRYKNKIAYNTATGEIDSSKRHMAMLEDFWLPRREGCLSLDTKIELLDGRSLELKDLIKEYNDGKINWVYSCSPEGNIVPGLISWAGITRKNAEVIDVYLDNGEVNTVTPDHKYFLRNGEIIEAKDLKKGSSIMPFTESLFSLQINNNKEIYDEYFNDLHVNIEKMESHNEKMDVGTLTIDEHHYFHDYHNFALSSGIFVMNSRGTEIDTLQGGDSSYNIDTIAYFRRKLYESLNVPIGRLDAENSMFNLARDNEITREEIKFSKFIKRLRNKFARGVFGDMLYKQLIMKNIITSEDWKDIEYSIKYVWEEDSHFYELKKLAMLKERIDVVEQMDQMIERYYSMDYIRRNILMQTEEEAKELEKQRNKEKEEREQTKAFNNVGNGLQFGDSFDYEDEQ